MPDPILAQAPPVFLLRLGARVAMLDIDVPSSSAALPYLYLRDDGRIEAGSTLGPGGRWIALDGPGGGVGVYDPFANLSFDDGVASWNVSSNIAPAQPPGFLQFGNGAGAFLGTLRQAGRRAASPGQSIDVGLRAQYHGPSGGSYGIGHASGDVTLRIVWYRANGTEISVTAGTAQNGAGLVGWQDITHSATAPAETDSYTIEFNVSIGVAGAVVDIDDVSYSDPAGSGP